MVGLWRACEVKALPNVSISTEKILAGDSSGLTSIEKLNGNVLIRSNSTETEDEKSSGIEHESSDTFSGDGRFQEALLEADLSDLAYNGPQFTWTNKNKTNLIAKKLNQVLVNDEWLSLMQEPMAMFGEPDFSDHTVCGVVLKPSSVRDRRPFRLYNYILHNELFLEFDSGYITYHPRAEDIGLSHLMFANDVIIFFYGGTASLHAIYETLDDFAGWSDLHVNRDKSELFLAGLNNQETNDFAVYDYPIGKLPIRYLGLPLMHRKLRISEYDPLLQKLASTFRSLAVKMLSYAGRLQLLSTVINGTVTFWMATFILPKVCLKKIESMCCIFLWSGSIDDRVTAKVAWSDVCLPKEEGGLGLHKFNDWNKVLCLRFIWLLFSELNSLWVQWQKHLHLQNVSFWSLEKKSTFSASWNSILSLRPLAEEFIKCRVNNGAQSWLWYDSWTPFGKQISYLGPREPRDLRVPLNAHPRSDNALALQIHLTTVTNPQQTTLPDSYYWVVDGKDCRGLSSSMTWKALRPRSTIKGWAKSIWYSGAVPRQTFNMWLANLNRLPTKLRLAAWGLNVQTTCCLCNRFEESRDHLFLTCTYATDLWRLIFARLDRQQALPITWSELLSWTRTSTSQLPSTLKKLATQSLLYNIWRQRNSAVILDVLIGFYYLVCLLECLSSNSFSMEETWLPKVDIWIQFQVLISGSRNNRGERNYGSSHRRWICEERRSDKVL
ncbi:hypothetical protein Bca52824_077839 [Brassica carinata]|uniref:Reverse transcriptase zinc-binding domain-containing protein n=1 Tax=Brassica carinata TaxID=52824 RepID=A0A8X7PVR0_BRACI|nr:hypothetical protein Bca52824_077839 [Brassica carinata]